MGAKTTKADLATESKHWMLYVIFVAIVSWVGLWAVIQLAVTDATKALLFVLLFTSIVCTVMPAVAYLNARFARHKSLRIYRVRFVRQSVFCGLFTVILAWLQMRRALSVTLALILLAVFVLTETFLITRDAPAKGRV